jgi:hypothetical protein
VQQRAAITGQLLSRVNYRRNYPEHERKGRPTAREWRAIFFRNGRACLQWVMPNLCRLFGIVPLLVRG